MKLAALCCTYRRAHTLGHLIESYLRQDYPSELRELVILDDAGEYGDRQGDGWRIVSVPQRYGSLGEKRNACAALASQDVEGFLVADDDDLYLPHWFRTQAEALRRAEWSRPSRVLLEEGDRFRPHNTGGLYHGGWAYRRDAFYRVGGYGPYNNGEDQELARRLRAVGTSEFDPCTLATPFYIYRNENQSYHLSWMGSNGYAELAARKPLLQELEIGWPANYAAMPIVTTYYSGPTTQRNGDKMQVELLRSVDAPGRNGPTNGMYALQKALRARIAEGLDWLTIKPFPASEGALPWFWHWDDRAYANWWNQTGAPFVQGPNMLFLYSGTPRIDANECGLLDAANCRAMFCHTEWYRELIARHRGASNQSPIMLWPYPIDPWPGEPLPDEYDLLIYGKNGNRPQLLEYLAEVYPRHIQIHYGKYQRQVLFEAARRSKACAYLADDDHGPLALQEILLAGCPAVGVRTGASFVENGVTGVTVTKLPPGRSHVRNPDDEAALETYLRAIRLAHEIDRRAVRAHATDLFDPTRIVSTIIAALDACRSQTRILSAS